MPSQGAYDDFLAGIGSSNWILSKTRLVGGDFDEDLYRTTGTANGPRHGSRESSLERRSRWSCLCSAHCCSSVSSSSRRRW